MRSTVIALASLALTACASAEKVPSTSLPYFDASTVTSSQVEYRIGGTDMLNVNVFQVEDLSFDEIRVDAAGNLNLPLIGSIRAAGLTPAELSTEIESRLAVRYIRNPQVSVTVVEATNQKVTVDGAVTKPGVYKMQGRTTLLEAVAMAEGPVRTADLSSVAVMRTVDDRRMIAVFDLRSIRSGAAADPVILGNDVVIVDSSRLSAAIRDVISALPAFGIFAYL